MNNSIVGQNITEINQSIDKEGNQQTLSSLIQEYEIALQKSNTNVLELKETIYELLEIQKQLKERINELEEQNLLNLKSEQKRNEIDPFMSTLKQKNDASELKNKIKQLQEELFHYQNELCEKDKIIEEKNEIITSMKKTLKSITNIHNSIETKDNQIDPSNFLEYVKLEKEQVSSLNRVLSIENEKLKINEKKFNIYKERMKKKIKQYKEDLKLELNEKILLLKELENFSNNQLISIEAQGSLREINELNWIKAEKQSAYLKKLEYDNESMRKEYNELRRDMFNDPILAIGISLSEISSPLSFRPLVKLTETECKPTSVWVFLPI